MPSKSHSSPTSSSALRQACSVETFEMPARTVICSVSPTVGAFDHVMRAPDWIGWPSVVDAALTLDESLKEVRS